LTGSGGYTYILVIVAFIAIFYFMMLRPQQRKQKAHMALLNSLKKGDTIIMASGMYGTVKKVSDDQIVEVEIAKGVTIKINRRAVSEIIRDKAEARAAAPSRASRSKNAPAEIEESYEDTSADSEASYDGSEETAEGDDESTRNS
jgi:preprotein translocase subunit YajC